jgi:hypothetical protein
VLGRHFSPRPDTIGLVREPFWLAGAAQSRSDHAQRACGGTLAGGPVLTGWRQGLAREHHGVSEVAPGKVRQRGSHRRWPTTVGRRNGPVWRCFNGGEGVPVAGEGGDGVLQLEEEMGDEGRSSASATMAGGGSSPKGAVDDGGGFTSGGVGVAPAVGRGHEARGGQWCSWCACEGGREGGGRKGWAASTVPFIGVTGGRGRRGRGGGSGAASAWKRETSGERGGPAAAVGTGPWATGARCGTEQRRSGANERAPTTMPTG